MEKETKEAERIFNKHYAIIFEYGEEMSEEIVVSLLASQCAAAEVQGIIKASPSRMEEDNSDSKQNWKVYSTIHYWQKVKQIIENK